MTQPALARRLAVTDAVVIGLGSMIGAGVFAAFGPAAAAAGPWLLLGLAIAAVVACCNALSSAQLAARYPTSGGTYVYGREELGPWWGFLAGWGFVVGKTASCAAMALTCAAYLLPSGPWQGPLAALLVIVIVAVNYRGITRTARLARIIVAAVLCVLLAVVLANLTSLRSAAWASVPAPVPSAYGVLQAAGLLFFAFAGYARVATLGEEVVDPRRTIPRAIVIALTMTVGVYGALAVTLLGVLGPDALAATRTPVLTGVQAGVAPWLAPAVQVGAALASLGALLALIAGIGRTALAMARERDLPRALAAVNPRFQVPHVAELTVGTVVVALVLLVDLRGAIGFSSFGVLLYYFVANAAAYAQRQDRRYPRWVQVLGMAGCLVLVATLPWQSVVVGVCVFAVGVAYRLLRLRAGATAQSSSGSTAEST